MWGHGVATFNAGSAYLQILPSFRGIEKLMQQQTRKLAKAIDKSMAGGVNEALIDAFKNVDTDRISKSARTAGDKWSTRYETAVIDGLKDLSKRLPEIDTSKSLDPIDKGLLRIKRRMEDLSKLKITPGADKTDISDMVRQMQRLSQFALAMHSQATGDRANTLFDFSHDLHSLSELLDSVERAGREGGRRFGGAFSEEVQKSWAKSLKSLPEIKITANSSDVEKDVLKVREELAGLGDKRIGIDLDGHDAYLVLQNLDARLSKLRADVEKLGDKKVNLPLDFDLKSAQDNVRDTLSKLDGVLHEKGQQAGETYAGAFADRFGERVARAVKLLPNIPLTADPSDAEQKLASIRRELEALTDKRVGVNINAEDAEAKLKSLLVRLRELDGKNVNIDVKTNAAAAAAELALISGEAKDADTSFAQLGENAGITLSRLGYMIAIGASVGSLIAPAAATAAVAVAGIGVAATAAVAGFGVLALGLFGIADAVKKIDAYVNDANKSAKSFSQSQNQIISAQQAVGDAERNLANTRQDAADAAVESQRRIADAERNVAKAQRDAAESVKQAQQNEKEAVQNLAQARQDAADQIASAVQREEDAERSVTDAVKDQKKAREELTQAIKDAQKELRDLQLDVKQNQIDIDQATTSAMKAKEELDKVMSNPRATEIERREALETYQEKILQIQELKNKQSDLAEQQAKANKDGVEGSDKVKNARQAVADADQRAADAARSLEAARKDIDKARIQGAQRIADAEKRVADAQAATIKAQRDGAERVADAQRAVADAQRAAAKQQRDSQRQILSGTEAVTNAQRQLAQASVNAGVAGGDAFDTMNDALNHLSPAGRAFAKWLYGLKPQFDQLQRSAQQGLLPGLQESIQTLVSNYLPAFDRFVSRIAVGMGDMFRATSRVLLTPSWRQFFSFIGDNALPALQGMWAAATNLSTGVANLMRALAPLSKPIGQGLVGLTEKFAIWSQKLQTSTGFQKFVDYAAQAGPKVVTLLEDMVVFLGRLVAAAAPMGTIVLAMVTSVFEFINSWDLGTLSAVVDIITILAAGVFALTGLVRTVKFVTEAWNTITLIAAKGQQLLAAAVTRFNTSTVTATTSTGLLNGRLFAMGASGDAAAAGLAGVEAAAGPVGLALLAIGGIWLLTSSRSKKAKEDTDELGQALEDLGKKYQQAADEAKVGSAAVEQSFQAVVAQNEDLQKAVITLNNLGVGIDQIAGAASGSADDLAKALDTIKARIQAIDDQIASTNARNAAGRGVGFVDTKNLQDEEDHLKAIRDKLQEAADKAGVANTALGILNRTTAEATTAAALLSPVEQSLADAQKVLADSSSTAQQKMDALSKAQDTLRQAQIDGIEADESFNSSLITLKETVNANKAAHDKYATSLGMSTQTGLRNRDMIEALVASADKQYDSDVALNGVTADAIKRGQGHYAQIVKVAAALGINTDKTKALIGQFGKVPKSVETAIGFKAGQFDQMFQQLEQAAFIQKALKNGEDIDKARAEFKAMISDRNRAKAHGWATGGPIAGPGITGGPTEDANLIWASRGEFMQPASTVNYYGTGVMEAIRRRAIPREAFPGYAAGGSVLGGKQKWPFNIDLSKTWIPDTNWLLANTPGLAGDGSFHGLSSDASVAKLQKFALAQRGKRYLWAAVGPRNYDCSGLVGNLYALATGKSLYHRYMSTSDMGVGRHGMVAGPGKKMTVYLGPGHTAANVGGLHVEAYGGNGTPLAIGRIGTRLSYYNQKLHLPGFAQGGMVDTADLSTKHGRLMSFLRTGWPEPPRGADLSDLLKSSLSGTFDAGGVLPPGVSTVFNGTGRPEAVLTAQQWNTISALAQGQPGGAGNVYNFEFRDTTLDPSKLRALQDREAVLARVGRAR